MTGLAPQVHAAELERVRSLRLRLVEEHPFWGHLLLGMRLVTAPDLPTFAATDCARTIWLNPEHTRHLDLEQLGFVLLHELGHVVLRSAERRSRRRLHRWNVATDYAINRIVAGIRRPDRPDEPAWRLPSGTVPGLGEIRVLLDHRFDGRIAEAIYELLDEDDLPASSEIDVRLPGADGDVTLPAVVDHRGGIDVHLPSLGEDQESEARERVEHALRAWASADRRGDLPGEELTALGLGTVAPTVPWERLLAELVEQAVGRDEYDPRRPEPRRAELGVVVPRLVGQDPGPVVVALDTSASMSQPILRRLAVELEQLADRVERLTLAVADAAIHQVVEQPALRRLLRDDGPRGGGGTDHRPVFAWLAERRPDAALFVGITDLWSRFPEEPPDCPVIWVVPERHGDAPWGRVVETC